MKISGWMHMRVLARAAKARLLRAAGRPDRPVERHPDGMQLQPSDLGSVRARAAPLQLARMNGAFSNARAWQEAARAKLRELLVVEQGDHVANESLIGLDEGVSAVIAGVAQVLGPQVLDRTCGCASGCFRSRGLDRG